MNTTKTAYEVRAIEPGGETGCPGTLIGRYDDLDVARGCAEEHAYDYHYGTVIVRMEDHQYDFGDGNCFCSWPE